MDEPMGAVEQPDDLDMMLADVAADPVARATYQDLVWREGLLSRLVQVRGPRRQRDVAEAMGTTQSAISELESGRVDPHLSTLQRYARAVGAQLDVRISAGNSTSH